MASSLTLSLFLLLSTIVSADKSPLDPDQTKALHSLNLPTKSDPCSNPSLLCDSSSPFRHVISLTLSNCSSSLSLSSKSLSSLSPTLTSLTLSSCRARKLTGVFLGRFRNLTSLTVVNSPVNASGPTIIVTNMKLLETLTISGANLTGRLPKQWRSTNITKINLSNNELKGSITDSITELESLESLDLSSNALDGEIPASIGDMVSLKNLSLSSNSISGTVPDTLPKGLTHLDLGSNQLNGTIPRFISHMKSLKYLNLEKNNFKGVMPFNASFIKSLVVFKIGENSNLCYNHTTLSTKLKLGIAPCDKHGLPLSPPPPKDDDGSDDGDDDDYGSENDESEKKSSKSSSHGPNKVVLGVAIGLSAVVFLIIFCVLISKCCCR